MYGKSWTLIFDTIWKYSIYGKILYSSLPLGLLKAVSSNSINTTQNSLLVSQLCQIKYFQYSLRYKWEHHHHFPETLKYWVGVQQGQGEGASLALVGHNSNDGVTIKMPYGVDVGFTSTSFTHHLFLLGWLKLNWGLLLDQLRLA